ncbi:MAG: hypothetical protein R3C68_08330 [Myxococcota bacterium]
MLHGSAIRLGEAGVAFVGRSGAGKSTACSMFGNDAILNDELIAITDIDQNPVVHATPFSGSLDAPRTRRQASLKMLLGLTQATHNHITPLTPNKALLVAAECLAVPEGSREIENAAFSALTRLCASVSWGQLAFNREPTEVQRVMRQALSGR